MRNTTKPVVKEKALLAELRATFLKGPISKAESRRYRKMGQFRPEHGVYCGNSTITVDEYKSRHAIYRRQLIKSAQCPHCGGAILKHHGITMGVDYNMVGAYKCPHCGMAVRGQYMDMNGHVRSG